MEFDRKENRHHSENDLSLELRFSQAQNTNSLDQWSELLISATPL